MLTYTLPDFTAGLRRNLVFLSLMRDHPEFFLPDVRVGSVYGCFPDCPLNGGRALVRPRYTTDQMDATFEALGQFGVRPRLTFTNMLAGPEHLADPYVRAMIEVAVRHGAEVIVYADEVGDFVRDAYARRGVRCVRVLSTTREILDVGVLNEALACYDLVVLNYNLNKDHEFLAQVEHPERLEVMVNELCYPRCPYRAEHYRHNSQDQLDGVVRPYRRCDLSGVGFYEHAEASPAILTVGEARQLRERYGIENYKIVGRGVDSGVTLESYLRYLVRPEHRDGLRQAMRAMQG